MSKEFIIIFFIVIFFTIIIFSSSEKNKQNETDLFQNFDFGNIISLDDKNAASEIEKQELLYVIFYLSNDQNCLYYMPEYLRTSKLVEEEKFPLKFAKIDLSKSPNISDQYEIKYVPSIILFHKGEKYPYQDENGTSEKLLKFMFKKAYDGIYKVDKISKIKQFMEESRLVLLSTLKDENLPLYKSFSEYAKNDLNIDFVSCKSNECIKEYGEDIYLFKQFDEQKNRFSTDFMKIEYADQNSLKLFLSYYAFEAGVILDQYAINMINENKKSLLIYFRNSSLKEHTQYDILIKEVGIELRGKEVYTAVADVEGNSLHEKLAKEFKVDKEALPTLVFYDLSNNDIQNIYMVKSANSKDLTKNEIKNYVERIQKSGKLKLVNEQTYNKEIIEQQKNVVLTLVDESAPKKENKKILTLMKNLAEKYNPEQYNIVFNYMDTSQNLPLDIDIKNEVLPITLLYKKTGKNRSIVKLEYKDFEHLSEKEIEQQLYETLYKETSVKEP